MGHTFLYIKQDILDGNVRICVSGLEEIGDAPALEKYYHINCLQYAKNTCAQTKLNDTKVIRFLYSPEHTGWHCIHDYG